MTVERLERGAERRPALARPDEPFVEEERRAAPEIQQHRGSHKKQGSQLKNFRSRTGNPPQPSGNAADAPRCYRGPETRLSPL